MTTYAIYVPRVGSLAAKVIDFLMRNPEETLSSSDISIKFGSRIQSVSPSLRAAVFHQHLACEPGTNHYPAVYRLGPARQQMMEDGVKGCDIKASDHLPPSTFRGSGLELIHFDGLLRVKKHDQYVDFTREQLSMVLRIAPAMLGEAA